MLAEPEEFDSWESLRARLDDFEYPRWSRDESGEASQSMWVFRGHQDCNWNLEPTIERQGSTLDWPTLEDQILRDFRAKAPVFADRTPTATTDLEWLAMLRHHGGPTRLLDVTLSPFVALYFATSGQASVGGNERGEIWAFDALSILRAARATGTDVSVKAKHYPEEPPAARGKRVRFDRANIASERFLFRSEDERNHQLLQLMLHPDNVQESYLEEAGCVMPAIPAWETARISSQQGLFLLNASITLSFQESLFKMMKENKKQWCHRIRFGRHLVPDVRRYLFAKMNIHELSLFPDMEGLARFLTQKASLFS